MPIPLSMPRLSDSMDEGALLKWYVAVGDTVRPGDHLADVETDKATMQLQSYDAGTVAYLAIAEGDTTAVGELIAVLAAEGESVEDAAAAAASFDTASIAPPQAPSRGATTGPTPTRRSQARASPVARKLAKERGVDLSTVRGSGPGGRITKQDVLGACGNDPGLRPGLARRTSGSPPAPGRTPGRAPGSETGGSKVIPFSQMRKAIARRLVESKTTIPHFTLSLSVNAGPMLALRKTMNDRLAAAGRSVKISVNDLGVRAVALALVEHRSVNVSWSDEGIVQHAAVNVGVAIALSAERGGGLVVPVIRDAPGKTLEQISVETAALAEQARKGGLRAEQMTGGTFTLSNLGMYGIEHFEGIINPPEAALLAVSAAVQRPVVRNGGIAIGTVMDLTLSADHRVVDGAAGAQFLQTIKSLLEDPQRL